MSTCEPSGGDPIPDEPDHLTADGHYITPDPLLKPGTFISNLDPTGPQPAQNGVSEHVQPNPHGAREPVSDEPELPATPRADVSNFKDGTATPAADGAESAPSGRKGAPQAVDFDSLPERPKWLPEGWRVDYKVRSSGASAGSIDRYYFEPLSGSRFRSKKEVDYFIQTGSKRKRKTNPDADVNSSADPGGHQQKKSGSRMESSAPLNFDFNNEPEKVRWVLTDALKDKWTPFVGDKLVPKSTRQEWNAAFRLSRS